MKHIIFLLFLTISFNHNVSCQVDSSVYWWNPALHEFPVVEGQAWPGEVQDYFDRLPAKAQAQVRKPVWELSKNSAGLMIRFRSNASEITVRYRVAGPLAMNHMPATGVSGIDLYAIDSDGNWAWCRGNRDFSDTITYRFERMQGNDGYHHLGREYRLYLPLYNRVEWLEIGVNKQSYFKPLPLRLEKPIVVYGTSIAQGACATRPGMAWTSILGRKMDRPLINLGFSGNGRLEAELIDLVSEVEAKIYILDCLPNLTNAQTYNDQDLADRILSSVRTIKNKRPGVPVLLTEHAGYTDGRIHPHRKNAYTRVNQIQKEVFDQLKSEGYRDLFYLTKDEINLQLDDMVDGTHPNDLGMMHYAEAYEKSLRTILKEPLGKASTTQPRIQYREPLNYDWEDRHRQILIMNTSEPPQTVILANSIIHFWGGLPRAEIIREAESWELLFTPQGIRNYAFGWDRIENVLWRIYHGELDGFEAKKIVVMIGTNNLHLNSDQEIREGLELLVEAIKSRQPGSTLVLMGLLPRRGQEKRISLLNRQIAHLAEMSRVRYANIGEVFLKADQSLDESLFSDGLHPNKAGYLKMRGALKSILQ